MPSGEFGIDIGGAGIGVAMDGWVAGQHEQVPVKGVGKVASLIGHPADDLTVIVGLTRVRATDRCLIPAGIGLETVVLTVGQRTIGFDLAPPAQAADRLAISMPDHRA